MKIENLTNLHTVTHIGEGFTVCVVADTEDEALEIAKEYFDNGGFENNDNLVVDHNDNIDCDYVITAHDNY